jgi:xanthine/uracil permease
MGTAAQLVLMLVPRMILLPLLMVTLVGGRSLLESRVVLASLVVCSLLMLLMTVGFGRLRTENLYVPAVDPISVPFCIIALRDGGLGTLAALVAVTGLFQVIVGMRLSGMRRFITPVVSATLLVLSVISLVPVLAKAVGARPGGGVGSLVCMLVALAVMVAVQRRGRGALKLWAAPIGMVVGVVVAMGFGIYDFDKVGAASWFGLPRGGWRLFGPQVGQGPFGPAFFTLLPSFLMLGLVILIRTHSASILTQFVSWRRLLSINFREVQRANTRLGLGSIACGLAGSLPVSASPMAIRFISQSGCASRRVGAMVAVPFLVIALFPKAWVAVTAVPRALVVVYFVFIMAPLLFRVAKSQKQSFSQARNLVLLGLPVLAGLIIEIGFVDFPDNAFWDAVTRHGLLVGSVLLIVLALGFNATEYRRSIETKLSVTSLGVIRKFMGDFVAHKSWDEATEARLDAVAEEALLVLTEQMAVSGEGDYRRLRVTATARGSSVELEFAGGPSDAENLEDRIALLSGPEADLSEIEIERDVSLRLLRHYATSVNHRQYHEAEIITAVVDVEEGG